MSQKSDKKGFTIIEVVLVLAIAGLIFIMVFTALPALQRGQRDTVRKNDVSKVLAAINSYQSNNRGQAPQADDVFGKYLDSTTTGASGITLETGVAVIRYGTDNYTGVVSSADENTVVFIIGSKCDVENSVATGSTRQSAVLTQLEEGGGVYYCQDA